MTAPWGDETYDDTVSFPSTFPDQEIPNQLGLGVVDQVPYVRWRSKMVRQSLFNDLIATLTSAGWMDTDVMQSLRRPMKVVEFYPEFALYDTDEPQYNTIAMDNGLPGLLEEYELGGRFKRSYRFNLAFYAQDNGTGEALLSDLSDRYLGINFYPYVSLYNYNQATPTEIVRMEVDSFQYMRAPQDVAPYEHHLFFGEIVLYDFLDRRLLREPGT